MAIFTSILTSIVGATFAKTAIGSFLISTIAKVATSALVNLILGPKDEQKTPGTRGKLQSGGDQPFRFPVGRTVVGGLLTWHNTWGEAQGNENGWGTVVLTLSMLPGAGLERLFVNGAPVTIDYASGLQAAPNQTAAQETLGYRVPEYSKDGTDNLWIKFYDGSQTVADSYLVNQASTPDRVWENTRVGVGVCYAILTYRLEPEKFNGLPRFKFEMQGIPLYDPSKDSTVTGGSGTQRYDDWSTWGGDGDDLPAVQAYNMLRGIRYRGDGEWVCGLQNMPVGRIRNQFLPAIAKCRAQINGHDGLEPTYRCGFEMDASIEAGDVLEQIMLSCAGRPSETGGIYDLDVGEPKAASGSFTDDHIIVTEQEEEDPFKGLQDTTNVVIATYPEPSESWQNKESPPVYSSDLEAEDGNRRLPREIELPSVPYSAQVQRLVSAALREARRFRTHTLTLPGEFSHFEPNDTLSWTSERYGYDAKLMRIDAASDLPNGDITFNLTEVDPDDYDPPVYVDNRGSQPTIKELTPVEVQSFFAGAIPVLNDAGDGVRPAIRVTWGSPTAMISRVAVQVRLKSQGQYVVRRQVANYQDGEMIISGMLLPNTDYEVRGILVPKDSLTPANWSDWLTVTTDSIPIEPRFVRLTAASQVFRYDELGGSPQPSTATLTASATGFIKTPYYEWFIDGLSQGSPSTGSTVTYTPAASAGNMPQKVTVKVRDGSAVASIVAEDEMALIGLTPGASGLNLILSNEVHSVPADADGGSPDLTGAETTIVVFNGASDVTADWSFSKSDGTGVTSSLAGTTLTVTSMTVDAGYVDITASRTGYPSITKRMSLTKARAGDLGEDGVSVAQLIIFKRSASAPDTPTGGSFDFSDQSLTAPSGWSTTIPNGDQPLYASMATAFVDDASGTDSDLTWSTPGIYAQDGKSTFVMSVFKRSETVPEAPTGGEYNFTTNTGTAPAGWSTDVPDGPSTLYVSIATASRIGTIGVDDDLTWSTPKKFAQDGRFSNLIPNPGFIDGETTGWLLHEDVADPNNKLRLDIRPVDPSSEYPPERNCPSKWMLRLRHGDASEGVAEYDAATIPHTDTPNLTYEHTFLEWDGPIPVTAGAPLVVSFKAAEAEASDGWIDDGDFIVLIRVHFFDENLSRITTGNTYEDSYALLSASGGAGSNLWQSHAATFQAPDDCAFVTYEFLSFAGFGVCYIADPNINEAVSTAHIGENQITEIFSEKVGVTNFAVDDTLQTLADFDVEVPNLGQVPGLENMGVLAQISGNVLTANRSNVVFYLYLDGVQLNSLEMFDTAGFSLEGFDVKGPGTYLLECKGKTADVNDGQLRELLMTAKVFKR